MSQQAKPGPVQFEKYLKNLENDTFANYKGIKNIEFLPWEGIFPCRLNIVPKNPKEMQEIIGKIASMGIPVTVDVRQNHFFIDVDEKKFEEVRISALHLEETHERTVTTTVHEKFSRRGSISGFQGNLLPKHLDFRTLMVSYDFDDLQLQKTQKNSVVLVEGDVNRILQLCYEVLDPFKIQYTSSDTGVESGKDYIYITLEDKTDYLMLVRKSESESTSNSLKNIDQIIDIRMLSTDQKVRLLTAYIDPEVVLEVAKKLDLFGDMLSGKLPEGCTVVKTDDFYSMEKNTIIIKPFNN